VLRSVSSSYSCSLIDFFLLRTRCSVERPLPLSFALDWHLTPIRAGMVNQKYERLAVFREATMRNNTFGESSRSKAGKVKPARYHAVLILTSISADFPRCFQLQAYDLTHTVTIVPFCCHHRTHWAVTVCGD